MRLVLTFAMVSVKTCPFHVYTVTTLSECTGNGRACAQDGLGGGASPLHGDLEAPACDPLLLGLGS